MDPREILTHRLTTLDGLLASGSALTGDAGRAVTDQIRQRWAAERQLLARLLEEAGGGDVAGVVRRWTERTAAFATDRASTQEGWTDQAGRYWHARLTLELLMEIRERLDRWSGEQAPATS